MLYKNLPLYMPRLSTSHVCHNRNDLECDVDEKRN